MRSRSFSFLMALLVGLASLLMTSCGSGNGTSTGTQTQPNTTTGTLVTFGTDQPSCDVQAFLVTIQSASLVPEGGGTGAAITPPGQPVDFASLVDFVNIISFGGVTTGQYGGLNLTLTNPQLTYLDTSTSPPTAVTMPTCTSTVTSNCTSFAGGQSTDSLSLMFSPPLNIATGGTAGMTLDFDMRGSVQTGNNGQITGVVDPQITITPAVASGTTLGEADSVYGIVQGAATIPSATSGFLGSFPLQVQGGVGQVLTIQVTSTTEFSGGAVNSLSGAAALGALAQGTFVEVDVIVDTSGNIIAQEVDAESPQATTGEYAGFLGRVISVTRDNNGNATGFYLLVGHEAWDMTNEVPLESPVAVTLTSTTNYWANWRHWNRDSLQFGPQSLGVAEDVGVYGQLSAASSGPPATPVTVTANGVFLRQRNVLGTFQSLLTSGSDNKTGGFTMLPCGALFGGQAITVLTFGDSHFRKLGGLSGLSAGPIINASGLLFYEQQPGPAQQPTWTPPTWVMQAKTVHELPQD